MRPIRLELKGFTAFRDQQVLDFEGLDLFAISGPTGSGKSSILDAITYALFGYVERVGKQVGQLVSQGQPRMAVALEFAVGDERYRVTRSTPSSRGQTKILLERLDGAEWRQAGEGADRVREADALIRQSVGLDYEAFTRSVLLPQGRFAEFLVGDAKTRRDILTELLGLELFERLARLAGDQKRAATIAVETDERVLATEYAGVSEEAVREADAIVEAAAAREARLTEADASVRAIWERWTKAEESLEELDRCARDVHEAAAVAGDVAQRLADTAARLAMADAEVKAATKAEAATAKAAEKAAGAFAKAESDRGTEGDLRALGVRAQGLETARGEAGSAAASVRDARARRHALERRVKVASDAVAGRIAAVGAAVEALSGARRAFDEATHADLVASVRATVQVGGVCPVCGAPVATLPKASRVPSLEKARTAVAKAEGAVGSASEARLKAERDLGAATDALGRVDADISRLVAEAAKARERLGALEAELAAALGGKLPGDPVAAVEERLSELHGLAEEARTAAAALGQAREARVAAERERDGMAADAERERTRLETLATEGLLDRARRLGGAELTLPALPVVPGPAEPTAAIAGTAQVISVELMRLAHDLEALGAKRRSGEGDLFAEAQAAVHGLIEPPGSLRELVDTVAEAHRTATAATKLAEQEAARLGERLGNAVKLLKEIADQRGRVRRFDALAKELRADRIVAFLQLEALQILAAAGSDHLSTLSGSRYQLRYEGDEFFVVDLWNGDEMRSARTLSGGETFLASLGLALALSEQVRSLSVTEKARLDSLFLDEGFGTLDPETLEVVVEAIEQLGGDGRMVGVITHVQELAIRMPARIEVEKAPRGSSLQVVT